MGRLSWQEYALSIACAAAHRSEDPFQKVGACALRHDKSVAGVGYNGAPSGIELDWSDREARRPKVIHAEINCLKYCQPNQVSILACTLLPCRSCLQVAAAYKVKEVVFKDIYDKDDMTLSLAKEFGIELTRIK